MCSDGSCLKANGLTLTARSRSSKGPVLPLVRAGRGRQGRRRRRPRRTLLPRHLLVPRRLVHHGRRRVHGRRRGHAVRRPGLGRRCRRGHVDARRGVAARGGQGRHERRRGREEAVGSVDGAAQLVLDAVDGLLAGRLARLGEVRENEVAEQEIVRVGQILEQFL